MKKTITLFILLFSLCISRMWGETIPAGTIIYVDVTNFHSDKSGYATDGKYYMSVTASDNMDKPVNKSNTTGANWDNGYDARKDTEWQELTRLATNFYAGVVVNESTVGSVSFWRKELSLSDHLWEVDACTPNMWNSKERKFTITSGYTHHDTRHVAGFSATTSMGLYPPGSTLYLKVNSNWKTGSARFAACFKRYGGEQWVDCSQVGSSDYYSVTVPEGEWPYVIYCRMNPSESGNGWDEEGHDRVWDQTNDIFAEHNRNLCVINDGAWSYSQYTWVYAPTPMIVGAMNDWTVTKGYPMTDGSVSLSLNADAAYPFKVVSVESWYGYGDTEHALTYAGKTVSQELTADKKDVLLLTAGAGEYTFTWNEGTKTVSVSHPTVTHPNPNYVYYKNTKGWTNVYAHIYGTKATVFPGPQLNSCSFGDVTYYYAALGNNANIEFNQGNSTDQDDLTNIASNKGKYYDPSSTSWKYFGATITLNNQSATSPGTASQAVELFNTALTSPIICPTKTGYTFGGYYTASDGGGVQIIEDDGDWIASVSGYTNASTQWVRASTELFAKWTPKTTTVTLHANGGSADGEVVATYDAALPSFDAITRSQHVLTGYWTSATGGTKVINADGSFAANSGTWNREDGETLELFAQWWGLTTPTVSPVTTDWTGSNVAINLSATSTYLAEPIVVFYVSDGTNEYELTGAPYGSDGNSLGSIGVAGSNYSTVHKATFTATTQGTYTVTAKLFEGKFIDNFEASATTWSSTGYGTYEKVTNIEREELNGSNTVMKITRKDAEYKTAYTSTAVDNATKTDWGYTYSYIHMRYYSPQIETPKVQYVDKDPTYKKTTLSAVVASTWYNLSFAVDGGTVDLIFPFITSGNDNSIYIDDVILSNEESMTVKVTTASVSTTIYSLTAVNVSPTDPADYYGEPITISLSANSTGLQNAFVVFLVNDGTTTFEVLGKPETPGGEPLYYTVHNASFTTSTVGNYTVTAKLYEGKLIDNFDGSMAHWKAMGGGTFNVSAANPAQQAVNGSSTVMQITRGNEEWQTVCTQQAADNDVTTDWNLDYGYIYISMYSTSNRATKMKYSDNYETAAEVTSGDLAASTWTRVKFTVGSGHQVDFILPFMPADGTMYIDDIILSNESSMTAKATSQGAAASFRIKDNKYYFTGNNKSSTVWNNVDNWNRGVVPSSTSEVFILAPVEIATNTTVHVDKVNIVTGGELTPPGGSEMTASGRLTVAPNAGLNVTGKIRKIADGAALDTRIATTPADLVLESSSAGNASLVFDNDANQATVQMYSKASIPSEDVWNWQFIGIPFTSANALYSYYDSYLYQWTNSGWAEVANGASMSPFTGYCITQDAATTYVMDGTLNPTTSHTFSVPAGVEMVFANSWTAPIYVGAITDEAFEITTKDIYLFNTGYKPEGSGGATANDGKDKYESGTYLTLPIHSAKYTGDSLIAPMQGFYVDNTAGSAGSITLSYDAVVRPSGTRNIAAGPMHAPKRTQAQQADNRPVVLKIWANGAVYNDRAVLLERSDFSAGFDNGWDGKKLSFGEVGPSVYVINSLGTPEAVSAIPDLEGTLVGFRAGTNNTCTMSFEYNGEDTFYLNDLQAQQSTQIASENSYTFTCTAGDNEARFIISATPISKTPTDVEPLTAHPSPLTVTKVLLNNHIYIIRDGRMFSMDGMLVK